MTISEIKKKLRSKEISCYELTKNYLKKIKESSLNTYITVSEKYALESAKKIDQEGFKNSLSGVPISLKDVISTEGIKTTAASNILKNYIPPFNATVWEKLKNSGCILLGKVNTDEFTMGSSTETSVFGVTKNPHNNDFVSGGSSGGSAAAVSNDECCFSIGTDTGGSIRQPANFCGCVAMKVTYGLVSRYGCISYASSFDTIGPITKTVEDAAIILNTIAGKDKKDATTNKSINLPDYEKNLTQDIKGKIIGLPKEFLNHDSMDSKIKDTVLKSAKILEKLGCKLQEISLPMTKYAIPVYYLLVNSEASTNLARYDGIRFGTSEEGATLEEIYKNTRSKNFGDEPKRKIIMGTFALSSGYADQYYKKAASVRTKFINEYKNNFQNIDAIIAPVAPTTAFRIGENISDPLSMYLQDIFTVSANIVGIPSLALPTEKINNLPTGIQIMGNHFSESNLLNIGYRLEKELNYK